MSDADPWRRAMAAGDFEGAWRVSDAALAGRAPSDRDDPAQPYHLRWVWDGRALAGQDVLVRCYHGLGDTIQFSRFLPALRRQAGRVTVECQAALIPLLAGLADPGAWRPFDVARPLRSAGCDIEIMELAHALRQRPDPAPYLSVDPPLAQPAPAIGLCWRANPTWRPQRSVPNPLAGHLLRALAPARVVSLQPGADLPGLRAPCPATIADTARLIAGLDLVISVDTMVAHLAGALGTPLCLLLDAAPDWRWQGGGWYRQVRRYAQRRPGEWHEPLAALAADVTGALAAGTLRNGTGCNAAWISACAS